MDEQFEVIKTEMEIRRASLSDKIEALEQQVTQSVHDVTDAVTNVKEAVEDTVSSVKDTVQETIVAVKGSVGDTVDAVKETFDVPHQVDLHPWAMLGGALALGFVAGKLLSPPKSETRAATRYAEANGSPARTDFVPRSNGHHGQENLSSTTPPKEASILSKLSKMVEPELDKIKGLAIATVAGMVRDYVAEAVPNEIGSHLHDIIDDITNKLGAEPLHEPVIAKRM